MTQNLLVCGPAITFVDRCLKIFKRILAVKHTFRPTFNAALTDPVDKLAQVPYRFVAAGISRHIARMRLYLQALAFCQTYSILYITAVFRLGTLTCLSQGTWLQSGSGGGSIWTSGS